MPEISPTLTSRLDAFAEASLGLSVTTLMERAGRAVASAVMRHIPKGGRVLIFCGGGNNGGDGYAAALLLRGDGYAALAVDALGAGQRTEAGQHFLTEYRRTVGEPLTLAEAETTEADCTVDALLGTGARLPLSPELSAVGEVMRSKRCPRIAVDLPLGVDAEAGRLDPAAVFADETVSLGFVKHGLCSYPARAAVGRISVDDLGLDCPEVRKRFPIPDRVLTAAAIADLLPARGANTHKGSYGHLLLLAGSDRYRGAALLAAAAALRMGAGLVTLASTEAVLAAALPTLPEVICHGLDTEDEEILTLAEKKSAILIGPGSTLCPATLGRVRTLLATEGAPLILDADALGVLAGQGKEGLAALRSSKRKVVLTPHPGELARLLGLSIDEVQSNRLELARRFAAEHPVTLILKGAATVIAEGEEFYINPTGGPALAKGGSGDVLAGAVASLIAAGLAPSAAARIAVFAHGAAGDRLAKHRSAWGVRPADLPLAMAEVLAEVSR